MISSRTARRPSDPRALKSLSHAVLSLLLLVFVSIPLIASPPRGAQGGEPSTRLEPRRPIKRAIAGGETHSYIVAIEAGQFVDIAVVQENSQVSLTLLSPEGKHLTEVEGSPTTRGLIHVLHIAETGGAYALDVHLLNRQASAGAYEIVVAEARSPTPQDVARVGAEKVGAARISASFYAVMLQSMASDHSNPEPKCSSHVPDDSRLAAQKLFPRAWRYTLSTSAASEELDGEWVKINSTNASYHLMSGGWRR
jgi:hypothetical protein